MGLGGCRGPAAVTCQRAPAPTSYPLAWGGPVVPGARGSPLSPSDGADPFPCPGAVSPLLSAEILGDGSLLGLSCRTDPRSPGLLVPPCPPASRAPLRQGQRAHPGEPHCAPCPVLAAAGDGSPALAGWGGGFQQDGHWSPVKSVARGCSATKCCHLPLGPSLASAGGAEGQGAGGLGAQLQRGEGAEEAPASDTVQAGQAARVR